jgi:methionyl-tRNA formyltransferase
MEKNIVVSNREWQIDLLKEILQPKEKEVQWYFISSVDNFIEEKIQEINPKRIFIINWSNKIPASIYEKFNCILFHMTDLPYGRGGSPLQNLIVRGHSETKISAIKVVEELDAGNVYLKKKLKLLGTAREIFKNATGIIAQMILEIIETNPTPKNQTGKVVLFKRRKIEDSNIKQLKELKEIYNYIRMLDCDGYPNAYLENETFKFEFTKAELKPSNEIVANVRIIKK